MAWSNPGQTSYWLLGSTLAITMLSTTVPGIFALIYRPTRKILYSLPEAAALSAFTISILIAMGLLMSMNLILYPNGLSLSTEYGFWGSVFMPIFVGFVIGVIAFPLTIGLVFPFGIPIGCALMIWTVTEETGDLSKKLWNILVGISTLGWMLVVIAGYLLAHA